MSSAESSGGQCGFSVRVSVPEQRLELRRGEELVVSYPISTSRFGLGTEPGSYRTPTGRFVIAEKIGDGAPPWMRFVSRQPTGALATPDDTEDGVLTRILWLAGLDPENANTLDRFIYIHGTNQETLLGTPASHGCVRMRNDDVIDLYARVPAGTPVEIVA